MGRNSGHPMGFIIPSQEHAGRARCDRTVGKAVGDGYARQNAIVVEKHQFGSIRRLGHRAPPLLKIGRRGFV